MKKIINVLLGAIVISMISTPIVSYAQNDQLFTLESKGKLEIYDEKSDSTIIIDTEDLLVLASKVKEVKAEIDEVFSNYNNLYDKLYIKIDGLDGKQDDKLSGKDIKKEISILDNISSYAGDIITVREVGEKDEKILVSIPKDGYYTEESLVEIPFDLVKDKVKGITSSITTEVMKDIDIYTVSSSTTGTTWVNVSTTGQGGVAGSATDRKIIYTNTTGKVVKYLPISSNLEAAKTLAPGDTITATFTCRKSCSTYEEFCKPGTFGNYVTTSFNYSFYLIY